MTWGSGATRVVGVYAVIVLLLPAIPSTVAADCPRVDAPADPVCRPWTSLFLPTAAAMIYAPSGAKGPWYGGGLEVLVMAWSDNAPTFGPSHGKLRFDIGALRTGRSN